MHIELTEMLRCPERHEEGFLVLSTGEMLGRMVRSGMLGCPVCGREYPIVKGVVRFSGGGMRDAGSVASREPHRMLCRGPEQQDVAAGAGEIEQRLESVSVDGSRERGAGSGR